MIYIHDQILHLNRSVRKGHIKGTSFREFSASGIGSLYQCRERRRSWYLVRQIDNRVMSTPPPLCHLLNLVQVRLSLARTLSRSALHNSMNRSLHSLVLNFFCKGAPLRLAWSIYLSVSSFIRPSKASIPRDAVSPGNLRYSEFGILSVHIIHRSCQTCHSVLL
jgi:hypothetical protein